MNKWISIFLMFYCSLLYSQQQIEFSHEAGFYNAPFYLEIDTSEGRILYAFQNNLNRRSSVYRGPMLIDKNTTLSFALYKNDSVIKLGSKSFFIGFKTDFNVVALTISKKSLYDSISGIYVHGPNAYYDTTLHVMLRSNYSKKMEKEVFIEIFNKQKKRIISQDAGFRIFGGMTIYYPEKSIRIIARKLYGNSRLKADVFDQGKKKYKQIILRHSGNDYKKTRFKDVLSTTIASESGLDVQANQPSHLFVNSEYWGVYNIREKLNEYYIDNNYDCGTEGVDMLQAYNKVEEGSVVKYNQLLDFIEDNNLKDSENYEHVKTIMDVENFANFWIHQIYIGNTDSRGNIRFWRSDSLDGRFRWIFYDTDLGWGSFNSTLLEDFTSPIKTKWYNPTWSTFLLRNLLKNKEFKDYFINQTSYLLHTNLSTDSVQRKINYFETMYKDEMVYHFNNRKRFQTYQGDMRKWQKEVDQLKYFALKRDNSLWSQLKKKFNLSSEYKLTINIKNPENGKVYLNNNELQSTIFEGNFFSELGVPFCILPDVGYSFTGNIDSVPFDSHIWNNCDDLNPDLEKEITVNISFIENKSSKSSVVINEIDYVNDCFEIFNQENEIVNLKDWKIVDKNNNIYTVEDCMLESGGFAVFYFNEIETRINDVIYQKINFRISSSNELISIYDNNGDFVDSVSYKLTNIENSYSRNIPFNSFEDIQYKWENNSDLTIGYHNTFYTNTLLEIQSVKDRNRIFVIVGIIFVVIIGIIGIFLYRRKRSISQS